jgi:hypothetical protein
MWEHPGVNIPDNETLFGITLALYLGGAALALSATALLAVRAVRSRNSLHRRIAAGRAAAERQRTRADADPSADTWDQFHAEFAEAVERPWISYTDTFLTPELTELAITEDQIRELKRPAALIAVGVIASTAGSVLSLFL